MSSSPQPSLKQLFASFFRSRVTAFGGPSMIAYICTTSIEKKRWLDSETLSDGVALCQMIPGATAMQTAAYVGLKTQGVAGAGVSFIGFDLPAFLMVMTFAALYATSHNLPIVVSAFSGLQAIIVATFFTSSPSLKTRKKRKEICLPLKFLGQVVRIAKNWRQPPGMRYPNLVLMPMSSK